MTGLPPRPASLTIETDGSGEWGEEDLRTLANALGPQVMIVHLPPVPTVPWCSSDEQAGFTVNDRDEIVVRTTGPLSPYTAMELASALTAYEVHYHQHQIHAQEGAQRT